MGKCKSTVCENMQAVCNRYATSMQQYAQNIQKVCNKYATHEKPSKSGQTSIPKIMQHGKIKPPKVCKQYAQSIQQVCKQYVTKMQKYSPSFSLQNSEKS